MTAEILTIKHDDVGDADDDDASVYHGNCDTGDDVDMGGCQNYGPFLGPYYSTAPNI